MIEWIIILGIIFCILIWYYSQSLAEYSFSQITEAQVSTQLANIWQERKPVIVSEQKSPEIWVAAGLEKTRFWLAQPIWGEYQANPVGTIVPVNRSQQLTWAELLGVQQIETDRLARWFGMPSWIFSTRSEAHIGPEGLRQTYGWATAVHCSDGEMRCILLHSQQKSKLPPGWLGLRWKDATTAHHPLWTQIQFIEIILRPGTMLLVPPHWIMAVEPLKPEEPFWWIRSDLHHPISSWAQRLNER